MCESNQADPEKLKQCELGRLESEKAAEECRLDSAKIILIQAASVVLALVLLIVELSLLFLTCTFILATLFREDKRLQYINPWWEVPYEPCRSR
jgi:hypothetical protein